MNITELEKVPQVKALIRALRDSITVGYIALSWCPERDKYVCYKRKLDNDLKALAPFQKSTRDK